MHTSFLSSPISQVSLLKLLLDVWVLQTSEIYKFFSYYTSSYLQQLMKTQV